MLGRREASSSVQWARNRNSRQDIEEGEERAVKAQLQMVTAVMKLKDTCSLEEKL